MTELKSNKKEKVIIKSIAVTLLLFVVIVAVLLFKVKIPNAEPLSFLPPIYATINGITAVLLVLALISIKKGKVKQHENIIKTCIVLSALFLVMYVAYHITSESTPYGGKGWLRGVYFFILITHIILSVFIIPLVLITFSLGWLGEYSMHRKMARITFPIWLYVTVSGVLVYLMISPYYPH